MEVKSTESDSTYDVSGTQKLTKMIYNVSIKMNDNVNIKMTYNESIKMTYNGSEINGK